jgi:hypothetical protein
MIVSEFLNKLTTIRNFTKSATVTMDKKDDKQSLLFGTLNGTSLVITVDEELPHATVPLDILIKTMSKLDKTSNVSLSMVDNTLKISHKNKKAKKVSVTEIKCPPSTSIPDLTSTDSTDKAKETKIKTPIQKVVPVKEKKDEKLFSLYIDTEKLKQLKILSVEKNKSLKDLINEAIEKAYF